VAWGYENGVFKPLKPTKFHEGQKVRLTIEELIESRIDDILKLAGEVYEGLSDKEIGEVEKIALNRENFWVVVKA